jgi:hypothetical protein
MFRLWLLETDRTRVIPTCTRTYQTINLTMLTLEWRPAHTLPDGLARVNVSLVLLRNGRVYSFVVVDLQAALHQTEESIGFTIPKHAYVISTKVIFVVDIEPLAGDTDIDRFLYAVIFAVNSPSTTECY